MGKYFVCGECVSPKIKKTFQRFFVVNAVNNKQARHWAKANCFNDVVLKNMTVETILDKKLLARHTTED